MTIDDLLTSRQLDRVAPGPEHARRLLGEARRHVTAAGTLIELDPIGAYQLAYDAARKAAGAVLASSGLRPTARGGHVVVVRAIEALGQSGFQRLDAMRRRRNQLEYPDRDQRTATEDDAATAVRWADAMCEAADDAITEDT